MVDVELALEHFGDFKKGESGRVLRDHVGRQDWLLGGDAPKVEVVYLVDNFELKRFIWKGGKNLRHLARCKLQLGLVPLAYLPVKFSGSHTPPAKS